MDLDAPLTGDVLLTLRHGSLLLSAATFERYFSGLQSVLLLPREKSLLILPVQNSSGGNLVKVINPAGDRAVSGVELFRQFHLDDELIDGYREAIFEARWDDVCAALVIDGFFCETPA
ncbi:MAG TPA: hypothetical protein VN851_13660 [Thermoanaerobaculia bacterium]|nr:hypothetical protein [Thermoanaerobaculia bacterium]